jgi:hypothetical protein
MKRAAIFSNLQLESLSLPPLPMPQGVIDARDRLRLAEACFYAARSDLSSAQIELEAARSEFHRACAAFGAAKNTAGKG